MPRCAFVRLSLFVACSFASFLPAALFAQSPANEQIVPAAADALRGTSPGGAAADQHAEFESHLKEKKFADAWSYALRASEHKPDSPEGLILRSRVRLAEERFTEAMQEAQAAVVRFPKSWEALFARSRCQYKLEKVDAALADTTAAIALNDNFEVRHERGFYLSLLGRWDEALADFERVPPKDRNALCLTLMSQALFTKKRTKEALEAAQQAVQLAPQEPLACTVFANALISSGDVPAGLAALQQAVNNAPDSVALRRLRAAVLSRLGDSEAALAEHAEIVRLAKSGPERAEALRGRAALQVERKAFHAAAADLSAAIEADSQNTDCYLERAECQREQRDFAGAERDLTTVINGVKQGNLTSAVSLTDLYRRRATVNLFLGDDQAYAQDRAEVERLEAGDTPPTASTTNVAVPSAPLPRRPDILEFSPESPLAPTESAFGDTRVRVRQLGDLQRLQTRGGKTFGTEQVRRSLERNFDVLLAARPEAPLDELLSTVEESLRTSFRLAGFPQPQIAVQADATTESLVVEIVEGARCLQGRVRIEGDHPLDVRRLEAFFLDPVPSAKLRDRKQPPSEKTLQEKAKDDQSLEPALWKPGKPAPLDEHAWRRLEERGEYACADQGYHYARVEARVVPDLAAGTAELLVRIAEAGPRAVLGEVQVEGAIRHSADDLISFLGVQIGQVIMHDELAELQRLLLQSGRFLEAEVDLVLPPGQEDRVNLLIKVQESPWARHLSFPLSPAEAALFRLRQWLSDQRNWPGDMVIRTRNLPFEAELVLGRDDRAVVRFDGAAAGLERAVTMLILAPKRVGIFSAASKQAVALDVPVDYRRRFSIGASAKASPGKEGEHDEFSWMLSLRFDKRPQPEIQPVVTLSLDVPAYYCFALLSGESQAALDAGIWTVTSKWSRLRFEDATGRLIDLIDYDADQSKPDRKETMTVNWEAGAFDRRTAEVDKLSGGLPNVLDPDRPLSGLVAFACDELSARGGAQRTPERAQALRRLRGAVDRGLLGLLDQRAGLNPPAPEEDPLPPAPARAQPLGSSVWGMFLPSLLPQIEPLFAPAGWPRAVLVESVFVLCGHGDHTGRALERLYSAPETGPLACWAIAALASQRDPLVARSFARLGRQRLAPEQFEADFQAVLDRRGALGETVCRALEVLRTLEPEEAQAFGSYLPPAEQAAFVAFHGALRASSAPLEQALPAAMRSAWDAGLRDRLGTLLADFEKNDATEAGAGASP